MGKRGQTTIFIIISVLVVASVALFFTLSESGSEEGALSESEGVLSSERSSIKNDVETCLSNNLESGIYSLGLDGFYHETPEISETYLGSEIPVYWDSGNSNIPKKSFVEPQLENYMEDNMNDCLSELENNENRSFSVSSGEYSVDVGLSGRVLAELNYPVTIEKGSSSVKIEDFSQTYEFDFDEKYGIAKNITEQQENAPGSLMVGHLTALASEKGFVYQTEEIGENKILLSLVFQDERDSEGRPFVYSFVLDYGGEENES